MPYKDPEAKRAWRKTNRDKVAKHKADFEARHPDRVDAYKRKQRLANRISGLFKRNIDAYLRSVAARTVNKDQRHRIKLRDQVIAFLGGCCEWCGQDEPLCLEIDHIRPIHRRTNGDHQLVFGGVLAGDPARRGR
ncbi:hypothetical protein [Bradyrhizobium liaoningense]